MQLIMMISADINKVCQIFVLFFIKSIPETIATTVINTKFIFIYLQKKFFFGNTQFNYVIKVKVIFNPKRKTFVLNIFFICL